MQNPPCDPRRPAPGSRPGARRHVFGLRAAGLALALLCPLPAQGRIEVVTLPNRDTVQLTIYNAVDLTLVKETRTLTFRKGLNKLEFSWANTLIDPTSVEFRARTHADAVDVLDMSFPPRIPNTLEWRIQSEFAGEVEVEIRYFTSGIRWSADYVAEASPEETVLALAGNVRVDNHSGEDYEHAQVRLVVGVIRLVEDIAQLARQAGRDENKSRSMTEVLTKDVRLARKLYGAAGAVGGRMDLGLDQKKEIVKESLSEYFLYTVEGRDTIPDGWAKRLPSFHADAVPITSECKFEQERWGDQVVRFYRFTNSVPSHLGQEPLPDGQVKAFRLTGADRLYEFVGSTSVKYIPLNQEVELELGADPEVLVKPRLMNWARTDLAFDANGNVKGWTTKETWAIEVQNSRPIAVSLDLRRNFAGDWSLVTGARYEKVDANKVKFPLPLAPHAKQLLTYELTTRHGTNATR